MAAWFLNNSYGRGLMLGTEITIWSFLCREPLPPEREHEQLPSMIIDWSHPMGAVLTVVDLYAIKVVCLTPAPAPTVVAAWMSNTLVIRNLPRVGRVSQQGSATANTLVKMIKDQPLEGRPTVNWHVHCDNYCLDCLEQERFMYMTKGI